MILPVIGFRDYWKKAKFWITVVLLGVLQLPLVFAIRPLLEWGKNPFMFAFGVFDGVLVALLISWVCSEPMSDV